MFVCICTCVVCLFSFYLRCVDDFSQRPHQRAVDPHQLLSVDLVRLVQHHAHFVLVVLQRSDHLGELVGDVELVGVEQEDDAVNALGEPLQHRRKVIAWRKRGGGGGRHGKLIRCCARRRVSE